MSSTDREELREVTRTWLTTNGYTIEKKPKVSKIRLADFLVRDKRDGSQMVVKCLPNRSNLERTGQKLLDYAALVGVKRKAIALPKKLITLNVRDWCERHDTELIELPIHVQHDWADQPISFKLKRVVDDDILNWLKGIPDGKRQQTIKQALRAYIGEGVQDDHVMLKAIHDMVAELVAQQAKRKE